MAEGTPTQESRQLVVWKPPHEQPGAVEAREAKARLDNARAQELEARTAIAKVKIQQAEVVAVGTALVLNELQKYLRMAQSPDFAQTVGPLDPAVILKIAEFVSKTHRLDTGQATENIAHAVRSSVDFSKLTQEERDAWRALAIKGGAEG